MQFLIPGIPLHSGFLVISLLIGLTLLSQACSSGPVIKDDNHGVSRVDLNKGTKDGRFSSSNTDTVATVKIAKEFFGKWSESESQTKNDLFDLGFFDSLNGWYGSRDDSLYFTEDGGRSFRPISISINEPAVVRYVRFADPNRGWVVTTTDDSNRENWKESIYATNDGGKSWSKQFEAANVNISSFHFLDKREIWVAGSRTIYGKPVSQKYFLMRTVDAGNKWIDLSDRVSDSIEVNTDNIEEFLTIYSTKYSNLFVLNDENNLYVSQDGGVTWNQKGAVERPDSMSADFIRRHSVGTLCILMRTGGDHGVLSKLTETDESGSWNTKIVPGVFLTAVYYLADDEIIATGSLKKSGESSSDQKMNGVVMISRDSGKRWTVLYMSQSVERMNSLAVAGDHIWVVGNDGLVISASLSDFE